MFILKSGALDCIPTISTSLANYVKAWRGQQIPVCFNNILNVSRISAHGHAW